MSEIDTAAFPRDYRKLLRVFVALVALGAFVYGPVIVWGKTVEARLKSQEEAANVERQRLDKHLTEVEQKRPRMEEYVREERAARCVVARNTFALCLATKVACDPVPASCAGR